MPHPNLRARALAIALASTAVSCGAGDAHFAARTAPGFTPQGHVVSVFGVFKEGLMSVDAWESMKTRISGVLGAGSCDAGYADTLVTGNPSLAGAIDDYTRSMGPTDGLVAQLAPAAKGDLVMVLAVSGQIGAPQAKGPAPTTPNPRQAGGGHRRRTTNVPGANGAPDGNELELSASLYSVPEHKPVGLVTMQYFGTTLDDALTKFTERLGAMLPAAHCDGWQWTASIDPDAIRRSIDP
jgi:hypothetical protein